MGAVPGSRLSARILLPALAKSSLCAVKPDRRFSSFVDSLPDRWSFSCFFFLPSSPDQTCFWQAGHSFPFFLLFSGVPTHAVDGRHVSSGTITSGGVFVVVFSLEACPAVSGKGSPSFSLYG